MDVVPDHILWADYEFYSGASPSKLTYHKAYADWVMERFPSPKLILEIGCNDGDLLRHFADAGYQAVGIDPAVGPTELARSRGLDVRTAMFDGASTEDVAGKVDVAIANHVVAHQADLHAFFETLESTLAPEGVAIVEVQYLPSLMTGNQFDHFYHEHRFFFSASTLESVARQHGLHIAEYMQTTQQGGSLRVVLERGQPGDHPAHRQWEAWCGVFDIETYFAFEPRVLYIRERLLALLEERRKVGSVAGYGATAKSTTLLNFCGISLDYIVDKTPSKIGRVSPGMHIPIVGDGEMPEPDTYLLLAWNYLSGVLRRERSFLDNGGRFLVPIPMPVLL